MLRRLHRPVLAVLPIALMAALAGCGGDSSDPSALSIGKTASRLDAVKISGDIGTVPTIDWSAQMTASKVESSTLIKGDGPTLAKGDAFLAHIVIADGFTKQIVFSDYDKDKGPENLTVGSKLGPLFQDSVEGARIGSRIAVTSSADEAFGQDQGNPSIGIGNGDSVLAIVDLMSPVLGGPKGTQSPAPSWMPPLQFGKTKAPSGFDFSNTPAPKGQFRKAVLITGTGPKVATGQTIVANYLGQVYGAKTVFDESYGKSPLTRPLSGLIKGWQQALVGVPVGSRVVLQIPPKLGYGAAGNSGAGIKGTDTLYFILDILATG